MKDHVLLIIAGLLYGTITVGGQFFTNLGLSVYEISLFQYIGIALVLAPFVLFNKNYWPTKAEFRFMILYALVFAFANITQYTGIALGIPVAIVVLLLYTQPIWTTLLGRLMLNEQITTIKLIAVAVAFSGIVLIVRPWDASFNFPLIGLISAICGGIFLSLWVVLGRKSGVEGIHYLKTTFWVALLTIVWLAVILPFARLMFAHPSITAVSFNHPWNIAIYMLCFALVGGVFPHLLFYMGMRTVPASITGVILILEPLSATIMAYIFFSQEIGLSTLAGGTLILMANYIVVRGGGSDQEKRIEDPSAAPTLSARSCRSWREP